MVVDLGTQYRCGQSTILVGVGKRLVVAKTVERRTR
jgi:hypothetical protein